MTSSSSMILFLTTTIVVLLTPGPAVMFVVARSVQHGRLAGVVSTLGLNCGALVHALAATFGLSAILASSAAAFTAVKLAGAGYLIYLGIRELRRKPRAAEEEPLPPMPLRRHFTDALVVNLLNPKTAIFFLAFLPQFVDPARDSVRGQLAFLGFAYCGLALLTDNGYALAAASARGWLSRQ
jgi:threonine/homoserine/homoserine lactone efflux protein